MTDDHSSAGFTAETMPVTTGLKLSSLLDYQIFQRARQEEGSIVFAGRLSGELAETATVEARLVVEGSTNAWRNVTTVVRGQRGDAVEPPVVERKEVLAWLAGEGKRGEKILLNRGARAESLAKRASSGHS